MATITLAQAKKWLHVNQTDTSQDEVITDLITTAEQWVEMKTSHVLSQRTIEVIGDGCTKQMYLYPLTVPEQEGVQVETLTLKSLVTVARGVTATMTVGYATASEVPMPLITAAKKLITYSFENRDCYEAGLPTDVDILINQYRRNIAWS